MAQAVYNGTPSKDRGLRDIVANAFRQHLSTILLQDKDHHILAAVPDLAYDILDKQTLENNAWKTMFPQAFACTVCRTQFAVSKKAAEDIQKYGLKPACPYCYCFATPNNAI